MLEHRPDVGVVDVRMPPSHTDEGLRAAVEVRRGWPDARIMVLSQYVEVSYADDLLASGDGGVGYLLKDRVSDLDDFLAALATVADGGTVLDPQVVAQLMSRRRDPLEGLTPREREVLGLMAEGRSNAAIARGWWSPRARSRSTPSASSPSSACCPTTASTGGCWPSSGSCRRAEAESLSRAGVAHRHLALAGRPSGA